MARWRGDEVRIELPRVDEAHVRMIAGEVAVTAAAGTARLEAVAHTGPPLEVTLEDGVLIVDHEVRGRILGVGGKAEAVITLTVPPATPVTVRTVSGEVTVAGLQSGASLTTVSGSITVTDVAGRLTMHTVSGDAEASAVDGEVNLNTVSGEMTLSGDIVDLTARSVSGDLTFDLEDAPRASLSTVSGEVMMRLPAAAGGHVDISSVSGAIDCAFPVAGTSSRRRLSGEIGDSSGGGEIQIRTMSGDVAVLRRETAGVARATSGSTPGDGEGWGT